MKQLSRVVWTEGMHLAQHHFQAQGRYCEDSIHFALSQLFFAPYGLAGLLLDAEAVQNGTVSLLHARGVMPDGLAFHIPDGDAAPRPIELRERFSPTQQSRLLHLAIPPYRSDGLNFALDGNGGSMTSRYVAETAVVRDEATGRDEKPVLVGRKNFRLVLEDEESDGMNALPIARIRRDGRGSFIYDPEYVPPTLQIGASPSLLEMLHRIIGTLEAKGAAMSAERMRENAPASQIAAREISSFWLLHTINAAVAPLRHLAHTRRAHPEQLYAELARLAGALCTFSLDGDPSSLPRYDHDDLHGCFVGLERAIRRHLEVVLPSGCVTVPLSPAAPYLHIGTIADRRCFGRARWFLGVRTSLGEADTVASVPQLVKVCSAKFTPELVRRAYPGLPLTHVVTPPAALAPRLDRQYFSIATAGPCWESMQQTSEVGVYVPDALPDADVELRILVETGVD